MLKYTVLLLNLLGLLFAKVFLPDAVTLSSKAPTDANAGTEFIVEMTINKGAVNSFAKLQLDFPEGFSPSALDLKGASLTFSGGTAKLIWTALPSDQSFTIKYKVMVAGTVSGGEKNIAGKFAYVVDNVKQTVDAPPLKINVIASQQAVAQTPAPVETKVVEQPVQAEQPKIETVSTPVETVNTTPASETQPAAPVETATTTPAPVSTNTQEVACKRNAPSNASGEFTVELLISKGSLVGFAKIQETIPEGFNVVAGETAGASFTFNQGIAKFVWVSLPSQADLKVSYKLIPMGVSGAKNIEGLFSYIENDETKKYTIESSSVNIEATPVVVAQPQAEPTAVQAQAPPENQSQPAAQEQPVQAQAQSVQPEVQPVVQEQPTATEVAARETATAVSTQQVAPVTNVPSPQTAVVYKVQICALQKSRVESTYFATRYNLSENVNMEDHEGWTKYTIGSFNEYKPTRDHREKVRGKGVQGAFVTAYNNGKRITVQEALMITSQKWYK